MTKRIGILTSGGDCAGLNATIRAVTPAANCGEGDIASSSAKRRVRTGSFSASMSVTQELAKARRAPRHM